MPEISKIICPKCGKEVDVKKPYKVRGGYIYHEECVEKESPQKQGRDLINGGSDLI